MLLPIALDVREKKCLVAGGGLVAARKAQSLIDCGARVVVIAPQVRQEIEELQNCVIFRRTFAFDDCRDCALIFACTNIRETNEEVLQAARVFGIPCNVADGESDFAMMATIRRGDVTIGISTQGGSPTLAKHLKNRIEETVGNEYAALLEILAARREDMKSDVGNQSARAELWRRVLDSEVLLLLREGKKKQAEECVDEILKSTRETPSSPALLPTLGEGSQTL